MARSNLFREKHPRIRYYSIDISELNDQGKIEAMLAHFELEPSPGLTDIVGKRTNLKSESD
ncbi:hypothetical protein, partial [Haloferax sp. KTX1]|uniref:hypothetical protein n=1 Tax=Haloferax sp. KTX1 TaxID=2600597 RepID=UPI001C9E3CC6